MMYKDMATILKPREGKRFKISTFTLDIKKDFFVCVRNGIEPGTYARLMDKEKHQCVMSNTQMEQVTNRKFVMNAHGKVLIGGLGIGMILLAIQDKPEVDNILVVEKYQEIIDLVKDQLPLNDKVKIIQGDIFEYEPEDKYNTIYLDIWNTANDRRIYEKEQKPLRMRYRKYLVPKSEDANRWINCWMYEANRDENFNWGI